MSFIRDPNHNLIMAKKLAKRKPAEKPAPKQASKGGEECDCGCCSYCGGYGHEWYVIKGIILLILGLALWGGVLSLSTTIAILLVLGGIKYILMPSWKRK